MLSSLEQGLVCGEGEDAHRASHFLAAIPAGSRLQGPYKAVSKAKATAYGSSLNSWALCKIVQLAPHGATFLARSEYVKFGKRDSCQ